MRRYSSVADTLLPKPYNPAGPGGRLLDVDAARRAFDAHDRGRTGYLGPAELLRVAEEVWRTSHPDQAAMSAQAKEVRPAWRKGTPSCPPSTKRGTLSVWAGRAYCTMTPGDLLSSLVPVFYSGSAC